MWGKLAQEQKRYRQKAKLGMENSPLPPVLLGLTQLIDNYKVFHKVPLFDKK